MFVHYGKHIIKGDIHPQASHQFSSVYLQGPDGVKKKGIVSKPCAVIYNQIPSPALVSNGILGVLIFEDG